MNKLEDSWISLTSKTAEKIASNLNYRHNGLVVVVTQDDGTADVLMVAFANKEAVIKTLTTGKVHYWSTSRKKLWLKGETSHHFQNLKEVYVDCDSDTLLLKVSQVGKACHTGHRTCFYRKLKGGVLVETGGS
jgi:phosphoribosyl-AMP cyclohydrolase